MEDVIVVVPVYKSELDLFEQISFIQLIEVLGKYPICFIMPEGLKPNFEISIPQNANVKNVYYRADYFQTKFDYSRLCLNYAFYNDFSEYRYMLIYQLDAFVFSDRLLEFLKLGYDYIGAPQDNEGFRLFHVGNGGLSLRRIDKCIEILHEKESILKLLPDDFKEQIYSYEDLFWGYCGYDSRIDFKVPSVSVAAEFALQGNRVNCYEKMLAKGLPFGLHGWPYCDYDFWKPVIECFGYQLPVDHSSNVDKQFIEKYDENKRTWYAALDNKRNDKLIQALNLSYDKDYVIWGNGAYGKWLVDLLKRIGVSIRCIFDIATEKDGLYKGIRVCYPLPKNLKKDDYAIVAVKGRYEELAKKLLEMGYDPEKPIGEVVQIKEKYEKAFDLLNPEQDVYEIRNQMIEVARKMNE